MQLLVLFAKSYVAQYFLILFMVALGMVVVCRSARRSRELKRLEDMNLKAD